MTIEVLSQYKFDEKLESIGINDSNVEDDMKTAYISIIGTPECLNYYLDEGNTRHYLKGHPNVLNLDFDDIGDDVMYNGHHFRTISIEQAEQAVDFIERMIEEDVSHILIHCRAGFSRSRAFAEFIYRYCKENGVDVDYKDRGDYTTMLNYGIFNKLNHAYWKKHKLNEYQDETKDYPDDIITPPIRVINRERNRDAWRLNKHEGK